jgi:hypothetical protein
MLPQLALHLHKEQSKKKPKIHGDYIITEKLDGIYGYCDYNRYMGWGYVHTRQQRELPSLKWAKELFTKLPPLEFNYRLIFEVTIDGLDFHTTNGILNRSKGECSCLEAKFNFHDMVRFADQSKVALDAVALDRFIDLGRIDISSVNSFRLIPYLGISSDEETWANLFTEVVDKGGEGIILKQIDACYEAGKRNSNLMKMKLEEEAFIECVDIYYTEGKKGNSNMNATLRRKSGVRVDVRIGKHSDITMIEADKNTILGKVVKIVAMSELSTGMFREPRFNSITNIAIADKRVI